MAEKVVFDSGHFSNFAPLRQPPTIKRRNKKQDFGNLKNLKLFAQDGLARSIYRELSEERGLSQDEEESKSEKDEWFEHIYAFDDDYLRSTYQGWGDRKIKKERLCRRVSWYRRNPTDCNSVHELDVLGKLVENRLHYLSSGEFRNVFLMEDGINKGESFVWKQYVYDSNYDNEDYESTRIDALVAEIFSHNERFVEPYGHCALAVLAEAITGGTVDERAIPIQRDRDDDVIRLDDAHDVDPKNDLTVRQKLTWSLEMAEALAFMHNYEGGLIVHDDAHLEQFLVTSDGLHVKLQDFNRAEIMLWDEERQEYCRYVNGYGYGEWRSPEEYMNLPLNEKIDVFTLGTDMYSILTGLLPFYREKETEGVQLRFKNGELPRIDPRYRTRSLAEAKLVEAIERCWAFHPEDRIDIFGVVEILRQGVALLDD